MMIASNFASNVILKVAHALILKQEQHDKIFYSLSSFLS